jgi:hypothetical protein
MRNNFIYTLYIVTTFTLIVCMNSCGTEVEEKKVAEQETTSVDNNNVEQDPDSTYAAYLVSRNVKSITAHYYSYKFGLPVENPATLFTTSYNDKGLLLDSMIYQGTSYLGKLSKTYDAEDRLINTSLIDSSGNVGQVMSRTFNNDGLENSFEMKESDVLQYAQKKEYDGKKRLAKITEYDANGKARIVTQFEYNDADMVTSKSEFNAKGDVVFKQTMAYNEKGYKTIQTVYDFQGNVTEKNFLSDFDTHGNARLVEKYDAADSLEVVYKYEYDLNGVEVRNLILNGANQLIRESQTTLDARGNQTGYAIFEAPKGFVGQDILEFDSLDREVEMLVIGPDKKQIKRKLTSYNERDLLNEIINYNSVDEPVFKILYSYEFF